MASVDGKTSFKIDELVNATVVDGYIDGLGQLILVTRGGAEIITGVVGSGGSVDPEELSRLTASNGLSFAGLGATDGSSGESKAFTWTVDSSISHNVGVDFSVDLTTSRVTFLTPGVYSVAWSMYAENLDVADAATQLGIRAQPHYADSSYAAMLSGASPHETSAIGSYTYLVTQDQIAANTAYVDFYFVWSNLDTTISNTYGEVMIQKLDVILSGGGGGGDSTPSRQTSTPVVSNIPANSNLITTAPLAKSFRLLSMTVDQACRVRLVASSAGAAADASRLISIDPPDGRGVFLDYVAPFAGTFILSPQVDGSSMETTPATTIPMIVDNPSGSTQDISVSFVYLPTE